MNSIYRPGVIGYKIKRPLKDTKRWCLKQWRTWLKNLILYLLPLGFGVIAIYFLGLFVAKGMTVIDFQNNLRYFLSTTVQSYAALIGILFVVFTFIYGKLPNYEPVIGRGYRKILKKYYEEKKLKLLFIFSTAVIGLPSVLILLINNKVRNLMIIAIISVLVLSYGLFFLVEFVLSFIGKSGKEKLFEDAEEIIEKEFNEDETYDTFQKLRDFLEINSEQRFLRYKEIDIDYSNISYLASNVLTRFGKLMCEDRNIGSQKFYSDFGFVLEWACRSDILREKSGIHGSVNMIAENFVIAAKKCEELKRGKYVQDILKLMGKIIQALNINLMRSSLTSYLDALNEIHKQLHESNKHYVVGVLYDIAESFGISGGINDTEFIEFINKIKIEKEKKIEVYQEVIDFIEKWYLKYKSNDDIEVAMKDWKATQVVDRNTLQIMVENFKKEIQKLKKKSLSGD